MAQWSKLRFYAVLSDRAHGLRSRRQKGGAGGGGDALGFGEGGGLVAFELEEEISAVLDDELHVFAFAVEGVAGDEGVVEIGGLIEALGGGEFAFGFGGFAFGFLGGDGDGDGGTGLVLAEGEGEEEVADVFTVEGKGSG